MLCLLNTLIQNQYVHSLWSNRKSTMGRSRESTVVFVVKLGRHFKFQRLWCDLRISGSQIHLPTATCLVKLKKKLSGMCGCVDGRIPVRRHLPSSSCMREPCSNLHRCAYCKRRRNTHPTSYTTGLFLCISPYGLHGNKN